MTIHRREAPGATATRILGTARQLFMQRGYRAVSINDIVGAAEITKPTLYYHFTDKEDLFVQMVLHMLAEMQAQMEAAVAPFEDTPAKLTALVRMMLETPSLDPRMLRQEAREHLSEEQQRRLGAAFHQMMFEPLRVVMADGLARGELSGQAPEELAMLFLCFMEGFHFQSEAHMAQPATRPPYTTITFSPERIVSIFLHGVSA